MSNRLETAIKASAAEARLTKQKVLKELKQRMEGLIQQIENLIQQIENDTWGMTRAIFPTRCGG